MYGFATGIDGRYTSRRNYGAWLAYLSPDVFQESGFACAGLAGKKKIFVGIFYKGYRFLKNGVTGIYKLCDGGFRHWLKLLD